MTAYVVVYNTFANFEVVLASYLLKTAGDVVTVGISEQPVESAEGFTILPDTTVDKVQPTTEDILIIPGGNPAELEGALGLTELIKKAHEEDTALGGICAGVLQLAIAGVLDGKKYTTTIDPNAYDAFEGATYVNENLTVSDYIVTAKANAYVDFALTIGEMMDIYQSDEDYEETVEFFKFFKGAGQ